MAGHHLSHTPCWTFTYEDPDLKTIETPNEGLITYYYGDNDFHDPNLILPDIHEHSLIARDSEGRDVELGHWQISWIAEQGSSFAWSTHIVTPSGIRVVYEHGVQVVDGDSDHVIGGNFGVIKQSIFDGAQRIHFEQYTFHAIPTIEYTSPSAWWASAEITQRYRA